MHSSSAQQERRARTFGRHGCHGSERKRAPLRSASPEALRKPEHLIPAQTQPVLGSLAALLHWQLCYPFEELSQAGSEARRGEAAAAQARSEHELGGKIPASW